MARIPPIPREEFKERFYACYSCPPIPAFLHDCTRFNEDCREALARFPKCRFELDITKSSRDTFWGIYACEEIAAIRVVGYNLLCMAPTMAFFFAWLFDWKHPDDLQDASIPFFVMLALLSLFWSLFIGGLNSTHAGETH
jgi:hypothetical protein